MSWSDPRVQRMAELSARIEGYSNRIDAILKSNQKLQKENKKLEENKTKCIAMNNKVSSALNLLIAAKGQINSGTAGFSSNYNGSASGAIYSNLNNAQNKSSNAEKKLHEVSQDANKYIKKVSDKILENKNTINRNTRTAEVWARERYSLQIELNSLSE